jgi:hypothetical protein
MKPGVRRGTQLRATGSGTYGRGDAGTSSIGSGAGTFSFGGAGTSSIGGTGMSSISVKG